MLLERLQARFGDKLEILENGGLDAKSPLFKIALSRPASCTYCGGNVKRVGWQPPRKILSLENNTLTHVYCATPRFRCIRCRKEVLSEDLTDYRKILPPRVEITDAVKRFISNEGICALRNSLDKDSDIEKYTTLAKQYKVSTSTLHNLIHPELRRLNVGISLYHIFTEYVITQIEENYYVFGLDEKGLLLLEIVPIDMVYTFFEEYFVVLPQQSTPKSHLIIDYDKYLIDAIELFCTPKVEISVMHRDMKDYIAFIQSQYKDEMSHTAYTILSQMLSKEAVSNKEWVTSCFSQLPSADKELIHPLFDILLEYAEYDTSIDNTIAAKISFVKEMLACGTLPETILQQDRERDGRYLNHHISPLLRIRRNTLD